MFVKMSDNVFVADLGRLNETDGCPYKTAGLS